MLNTRSLIKRVEAECPLTPGPSLVRTLVKGGGILLKPADVFDKVSVKGRKFLLGGGVSGRPKKVKFQMARRYRTW